MLRRNHSTVQRFDIELYGNSGRDDDVILLTGPALEAGSCSLKGRLVWYSLEHTSIRRITLKLVGTLQLSWAEPGIHKVGPLPLRFEKHIYTQEYKNLRIPGQRVELSGGMRTPVGSASSLNQYFSEGKPVSPKKAKSRSGSIGNALQGPLGSIKPSLGAHSASSAQIRLSSSAAAHSKSIPNIPALQSSQSVQNMQITHHVPPGNYTFPFEMIIPGDISETIECNRYAKLNYTLYATVERAVLQEHLNARRDVSIVRTVGVDNYDVAHTVSIENTWPQKIEYCIKIPCKAVPFGSQLEVQFAMVPLAKGLKLGRMRTEIVEYVTLKSPHAETREEENVVGYQFFDVPANFDHMADEWQMMHMVKLPTSLSKCSQDAEVEPYVKILHKFRCFIGLVNADGHTSELRASLPITLYISPNVRVMHPEQPRFARTHSRKNSSPAAVERPLFHVEPNRALMESPSLQSLQDVAAPPTYSHHIYDRVYSNVTTPIGSPTGSTGDPVSRPISPLTLANENSSQSNLASGLRSLVLHRQKSNPAPPAPLTRAGSQLSVEALSRVPSYAEAINEQATADCAPGYSD